MRHSESVQAHQLLGESRKILSSIFTGVLTPLYTSCADVSACFLLGETNAITVTRDRVMWNSVTCVTRTVYDVTRLLCLVRDSIVMFMDCRKVAY